MIYIILFIFCFAFLIGYIIGFWVAPTDNKYSEMKQTQDLISYLIKENDNE